MLLLYRCLSGLLREPTFRWGNTSGLEKKNQLNLNACTHSYSHLGGISVRSQTISKYFFG